MERLTERDAYWYGEEFWTSAKEPDDDEIDEIYMKLKQYEDLEEQGLLLRLPCKVGDTIYRINQYAKESIISMKVLQVRFGELYIGNKFLRIDAINDEDMGEFCYLQDEIGKTVFLTRTEAERALKQLQGD